MEIKINKKYKITTDPLNLVLKKKTVKTWIVIGYYSNFADLYKSMLKLELFSNNKISGVI